MSRARLLALHGRQRDASADGIVENDLICAARAGAIVDQCYGVA
jgi:hypothetical protein